MMIAPVPAKTRANVPRNSAANFFTDSDSRRNLRTNFFAPRFDLGADLIPDHAYLLQLLLLRTGRLRRVGKTPVQPLSRAGKDGTSLGVGFITHRYDIGEELSGLEDIEHRSRFFFRNIDPDFRHHLHRERIERAAFESGALCLEEVFAKLIHPCFRHLAARAVVYADEENF